MQTKGNRSIPVQSDRSSSLAQVLSFIGRSLGQDGLYVALKTEILDDRAVLPCKYEEAHPIAEGVPRSQHSGAYGQTIKARRQVYNN